MTIKNTAKFIFAFVGFFFFFGLNSSQHVSAEENNESTQVLQELYLVIPEDYKDFWNNIDYYVELD